MYSTWTNGINTVNIFQKYISVCEFWYALAHILMDISNSEYIIYEYSIYLFDKQSLNTTIARCQQHLALPSWQNLRYINVGKSNCQLIHRFCGFNLISYERWKKWPYLIGRMLIGFSFEEPNCVFRAAIINECILFYIYIVLYV